MKARLLSEIDGQRTFAVVFDSGDQAMEGLLAVAREHRLAAASFTGIGAFARVTLGYFEVDRRDYKRIQLDEQVEVLSLTGNVATAGAERKVHAHIVVSKADGSAWGGHLLDGVVRPTLEVILVESPAHLRRSVDPSTGLPLLELER